MALKIITSQGSSEPIDEGVYEADITRIYEHTEFNRFSNENQEGLRYEFTIVDEGAMNGRKALRFVNPFLTPKAILWGIWKAVRGAEPTVEDLGAIESSDDLIEAMAGKTIKIVVKNRTSAKGNVYYTVSDFVKSSRAKAQHEFLPGAPEGKQGETPPHPATTEPKGVTVEEAKEIFSEPTPSEPEQGSLEADELDSIAKELDDSETSDTVKKATPKRGA